MSRVVNTEDISVEKIKISDSPLANSSSSNRIENYAELELSRSFLNSKAFKQQAFVTPNPNSQKFINPLPENHATKPCDKTTIRRAVDDSCCQCFEPIGNQASLIMPCEHRIHSDCKPEIYTDYICVICLSKNTK